MTPILSIITITYNAEPFVGRTLESVQRALDFLAFVPEIEYLVIDGASTDTTLQIAQQYSFINKIISEQDKGLYDAMNKGLSLATGEYVWFLNAGDEIFAPETLQKLLEVLVTKKTDVVYSDAMFVNDAGEAVGLRTVVTPHSLPKKLTWQAMKYGMKVCHQAFIVKRTIVPMYIDHNLSADLDWEIACLKASKHTQMLDFVLCKYLMGGLSVQKHRQSLIDRFKVLRVHFGLFPTVIHHVWITLRLLIERVRN